MKKILLIILIGTYIFGFSQEKSQVIEGSITSVQAGLLGIWINNETKIFQQTTLRSEIGIGFGYSKSSKTNSIWTFAPVLNLEP